MVGKKNRFPRIDFDVGRVESSPNRVAASTCFLLPPSAASRRVVTLGGRRGTRHEAHAMADGHGDMKQTGSVLLGSYLSPRCWAVNHNCERGNWQAVVGVIR